MNGMETIRVTASGSYDVVICHNCLDRCGKMACNVLGRCRLAILTDDTVDALYGSRVMESMTAAGIDCIKYVIPHGETSKTMEHVMGFVNMMAENHFTRSDAVAALGGGVPGDMAGFAAAVFLRGIRYVQIPTTLLAAVDSSVGGKTAVDITAGKNLVGAFHQPSLVFCDTATLDTLPPRILRDGFAEVVKYGVILDKELFAEVSEPPVKDMSHVIAGCVSIKRDVVAEDEFDNGRRQLLNFGHTVGHAIELLSDFSISHGEAVAMGMVRAARMGAAMGLPDCTAAIETVLKRYGFDTDCPFGAEELYDAALSDKKRKGDTINLVLPHEIGNCDLFRMPVGEFGLLLKKTENQI